MRPEDRDDTTSLFDGLSCEIQVHTRAQNLWSETTHDLSYKPAADIPMQYKRSLNRLEVLTELFDDEVSRIRREIMSLPGFKEAQVLSGLEPHFYHLSSRSFDKELSIQIIEHLMCLYGDTPAEGINTEIDRFVEAHAAKLGDIYRRYETDERPELLFVHQPEALLIFHRLETDQFTLHYVWSKNYHVTFLEHLAIAWGKSFS